MNRLKLILIAFCAHFVGGLRRQFCTANVEGVVGTHEKAISKFTDAAITTRHLLYKVGTDIDHIAVAGASDAVIGTVADEAAGAEELVHVNLLGKGPTKKMVAAGAITVGTHALVYAATGGKVAATGTVCVGFPLTSALADGDVIEVSDIQPVTIASPGIAASTFNAHTILIATTDDTPAPLTVGASTMVGRKATGNIVALTGEEAHVISHQGQSSIVAAPVAAAGADVTDAGQLGTAGVVRISSDGATKGVKLPTGIAGMVVEVINTSATAAELYAAAGGTVNGGAADASVVVPASKGVRCFCTSADTWTVFDMTALAAAS